MSEHEHQALYVGTALLAPEAAEAAAEQGVEVAVSLRGAFSPLDGLFHWYGRLEAGADLGGGDGGGARVRLTTPHGSATGRLSDRDPWGRWRVGGTGTPPF